MTCSCERSICPSNSWHSAKTDNSSCWSETLPNRFIFEQKLPSQTDRMMVRTRDRDRLSFVIGIHYQHGFILPHRSNLSLIGQNQCFIYPHLSSQSAQPSSAGNSLFDSKGSERKFSMNHRLGERRGTPARQGGMRLEGTLPRFLIYQPKTARTPPHFLIYQPKTARTPPHFLIYQPKTAKTPPRFLIYQPKTARTPPHFLIYQPNAAKATLRFLNCQAGCS